MKNTKQGKAKNMKKILIGMIFSAVVFAMACGGAGEGGTSDPATAGAEVVVKVGEKEQKFSPVSSWSYQSDTVVNKSIDGKLQEDGKPAHLTIVFGNYELDTSKMFASINKQQLKPEQVRVEIALIADKDSNSESQLKSGEYSAASKHYTRVSLVKVYHLVDGKEEVEQMNSRDWTGKVVLSSLDGQTIKGEIDMSEGGVSIKGPFAVKKGESVK